MSRTKAVPERTKRPHLRDLFQAGELLTIEAGGQTFEVWVRNPPVDDHDEAIRKAGAKSARLRAAFKDQESDDALSLQSDLDQLETRQNLEEFILSGEDADLREQAYNDVLFGEWGSNWSDEEKNGQPGLAYLHTLEGLFTRKDELREKGVEPREIEEDPEVVRLQAAYDAFQGEVDERLGALRQAFKAKFQNEDEVALRKEAEKRLVDLLSRSAWVDEYMRWMLYFSCRDPDNHRQLYFNSPAEIGDLPQGIQTQIQEKYREVSRAGTDLKVLFTPETSLDLSAPSGASVETLEVSSPTG